MATKTENLNLIKADEDEQYSIKIVNDNLDILDNAYKENKDNIKTIANDFNEYKEETTEKFTNVFTKEEVLTKIEDLIGSAPEALDTFNELAKALGDDPNFATTILTLLNSKVDKEDGKALSDNNYTDEEIKKVEIAYNCRIPYVLLEGENNSYEANVEGITEYTDGLPLCIKLPLDNTDVCTVNINNLGAITVQDSEELKANVPYNIRYEITSNSFIVLDKGGDKGIDTSDATATSEDILINKSAYGPNGKIEGAMPNNSGINKVLALNETYSIPKGYQDGTSKVTQSIANNGALNGSIGVNGTFNIPAGYTSGGKVTQSIPVLNPNYGDQLEISEITVGAFSYGVANNYAYMKMPNKDAYLNGVQWIFHYEPYLLAQNIAQGANIFGIAGSAAILRENSGSFSCNGRTTYTVTLGYRPKAVYLSCYHNSSNSSEIAVIDGKGTFSKTSGNLGISVTITNDGFQYYATSGSTLSPTWYSVG